MFDPAHKFWTPTHKFAQSPSSLPSRFQSSSSDSRIPALAARRSSDFQSSITIPSQSTSLISKEASADSSSDFEGSIAISKSPSPSSDSRIPSQSETVLCILELEQWQMVTHSTIYLLEVVVALAIGRLTAEKQLSISGKNWGEVDLNGNMLSFNVGQKQAFEISLADVSQTQLQGKTDVILEFHVDDTTGANEKDSLMEISFRIPTNNTQFVGDENRPPEQVGQFLYGQVGIEKGVNAVITNGRVVHVPVAVTFLSQDLHLLESVEFKQRIKHVSDIIQEVMWENVDPDTLMRVPLLIFR